jgi:hypothetical protein
MNTAETESIKAKPTLCSEKKEAQKVWFGRRPEFQRQRDCWMRGLRADQIDDAKYGGKATEGLLYFRHLLPPYKFPAVRSFGECGAKRDESRPSCLFRSQELRPSKPANIGNFLRRHSGERDLPMGYVAEGKVLETNRLGGEKRSAWGNCGDRVLERIAQRFDPLRQPETAALVSFCGGSFRLQGPRKTWCRTNS